jgi:RHS repeat-associated protein
VTYDGSNRISKIKDPLNIPLTLGYGTYGLATVQDTAARVTQVTVDASGRLTAITDPDNISTGFGYDASLRLSTITNRQGFTTTLGYDGQSGTLATVTAPAIKLYNDSVVSPVTTMAAWQKLGVPYTATSGTPAMAPRADTVKATVTEPGGAITRYTVNRWGTPVQITDPLGRLTTTVFDVNGLARRTTYPSGAIDSAVYNSSGLPTFVQTADATNRRNILYANWAQPDSAWGGPQPAMRAFIGTNGRADSVRIGGSSVTHYTYDNTGRVVTSTDPEGHLLGKHWFAAIYGNASQDSLPGGLVTTYGYDAFGRDTSVQRPLTPARRVHFDLLNRPTQYLDGVYATPTAVAYDSAGNVKSVTDAKGQVYGFAYNALGWLTVRSDPTGHADTLKYDRDGELMRRINRRGQILSFTYDALHRPTQKAGTNADTFQWTFSTDGLLVTATSPVSVETSYLNPRGQSDSVKTVLDGTTFWRRYHYTAIGMADSVAPSGGTIAFRSRKYTFDPALLTVTGIRLGANTAGTTGVSYDHDLKPMLTTFRGADQEARQYDAVNLLASISSTSSYADTVTRMLAYDKEGRLTQQVDGGGQYGVQYYYDGLGRLIADSGIFAPNPPGDCQGNPPPVIGDQGSNCIASESWTTSAGGNFAYDSVGNRTDNSGAYSTGNRITAFGGCTYGTDVDGNVTSRSCSGQSVIFKWTADGLLDTVGAGSQTFGYHYDAAGRLVRKDSAGTPIRYFLWDGTNLLAELNGAANAEVAEYSYYGTDDLHAIVVGGVEYDAHRDVLRNVVTLTDSAQHLKRTYVYDDWGNGQNSGDYLPFNGADRARWKGALEVGNEAGLYYMRARWYEPQTGRFLSEDPIGLEGGINPYTLASDDPVNYSDPNGTCALEIDIDLDSGLWYAWCRDDTGGPDVGNPRGEDYAAMARGDYAVFQEGWGDQYFYGHGGNSGQVDFIRPVVVPPESSCQEFTGWASVGVWSPWVETGPPRIPLTRGSPEVITADAVTSPGPIDGGEGEGIDATIIGQVHYWGVNGETVGNFAGGVPFPFRIAGVQTITVRFKSLDIFPTGVKGELCP